MIGSQQGLPRDPASTVAFGHQSVVNCLMANTYSIKVPHPLSEGMGHLEVVSIDQYYECTILVSCGLSWISC